MLKLTPEKRQSVIVDLALWRTANQQAQKQVTYSQEWFAEVTLRNNAFNRIMKATGLSMKRCDKLVWGQASIETYWLPDGSIRPDIVDTI
jgi:hypothetical protein